MMLRYLKFMTRQQLTVAQATVIRRSKRATRLIRQAIRQPIASSTMLQVTARFYGQALE